MKIAAASIELQSSHFSMQQLKVSERLEMWRDAPAEAASGQPRARPDLVRLSGEGIAAQQADATAAVEDVTDSDPRLAVLISMIEALTGRPVRFLRMSDLQGGVSMQAAAAPAPNAKQGEETAPRRAGFGIEYDYEASYTEVEQTRFDAEGVVRTADGAEIRFQLSFSMERSYTESVSTQFRAGDARLKDPLMLDFGGPAAALSDQRFAFDLDADGTMENIPMISGSGFLAFDRNANGQIDDGRELFGPMSGNGFADLAQLDGDGNGWIDENDTDFAKLRIWQPDADGKGTLKTLAEAGIGALYLNNVATPFSVRNAANQTLGEMRASSIYLREDGGVGTVSQVDLSV